jgi:hypothetical protein
VATLRHGNGQGAHNITQTAGLAAEAGGRGRDGSGEAGRRICGKSPSGGNRVFKRRLQQTSGQRAPPGGDLCGNEHLHGTGASVRSGWAAQRSTLHQPHHDRQFGLRTKSMGLEALGVEVPLPLLYEGAAATAAAWERTAWRMGWPAALRALFCTGLGTRERCMPRWAAGAACEAFSCANCIFATPPLPHCYAREKTQTGQQTHWRACLEPQELNFALAPVLCHACCAGQKLIFGEALGLPLFYQPSTNATALCQQTECKPVSFQ